MGTIVVAFQRYSYWMPTYKNYTTYSRPIVSTPSLHASVPSPLLGFEAMRLNPSLMTPHPKKLTHIKHLYLGLSYLFCVVFLPIRAKRSHCELSKAHPIVCIDIKCEKMSAVLPSVWRFFFFLPPEINKQPNVEYVSNTEKPTWLVHILPLYI